MTDTVVIAPASGGTSTSTLAGLSWPSIVAGAIVACALTLLLLAFGTGLGLTMVSPWSGAGVSATTFKITTGLYLIVIAMLASSIGGYIAGRLRSSWADVHRDEVYFRDTAHGFIAWALATVLGATALALPATSLIGGSAVGASQGAVNGAQSSGPMEGYVDVLLRPDPAAPGGSATATPAGATTASDSQGEMVRLFTRSFRDGGELKGPDRERAAKVVVARTGMSQADADKRVNDVVTQIKSDADAARKATSSLAFWLTAAMLLGAFCASLAATEGGALRDGTWKTRR